MAPTQADLARAVCRRQHEQRLSQVAAGVAFWLTIAVFPAGLVVVNVVGLVVDQEAVARFVGRFVSATPGSLGDTVAQQLQAVAAPTPGTIVTNALLVVVALWTVSTAMHHLIRGILDASGAESAGTVLVRTLAIAAEVGGSRPSGSWPGCSTLRRPSARCSATWPPRWH